MPREFVVSIADPRLDPYRNLKFTSQVRRARLFVAEGDKLVQRLLSSGLSVHSILASDTFLSASSIEIPDSVTTLVASDRFLREVVGFKFHRGVLACGVRPGERGFADSIASALAADDRANARGSHRSDSSAGRLSSLVVCVDIQDPTNLGTILRTADAFGLAGAVLAGDCADPFSRRVLRVSMGASFHLPLIRSADLGRDLVELRDRWQMTLIAAVASAAGEPLAGVAAPHRWTLLLGNESTGLAGEWVRLCDRRVTIPMHVRADSLNVAVATGILLYHFTCPPNTST